MSTLSPIPPLEITLSALTVPTLQMLARRCGTNVPKSKAGLIGFIGRAMHSPGFIAAQLKEADPTTRLALAEAAHGNGTLDPGRFWAKYGISFEFPTRDPYDYSALFRTHAAASVADLFFFDHGIPSDLIAPIRTLLPAPTPFALESFESLADSEAESLSNVDPKDRGDVAAPTPLLTEESALHDLVATLTLAGDNKILVGETTGQPTLAAVRALRERFLVPDALTSEDLTRADEAIRPFAFAMIAQAAGLARTRTGRLELTKVGRAALVSPTPNLLKACWEAWVTWNGFDELSRVRGLKGQKAKGQQFTSPADRKKAISQALATCPSGRWIPVEDFLRFVRLEHNFAVDRSEYSRLYLGSSSEYGWLGYLASDVWYAVNGAYVRVILLEYAAALGLIDVATIPLDEAMLDFDCDLEIAASEFSRYNGLAHLRVNNLGQYILGKSASYDGPARVSEQTALTVLPSLDVVIANRAGLPPNDRAMLERFATRVSDDVYRLSKDRLLEAIEDGLDPREVEDFLRRRGIQDLPQTAKVLFADSVNAAQAVRAVGPALLIECTDAHLAAVISHDRTLSTLCLLAGERHLVVPETGLAAFRRGLRKLGYALPERALAVKARKPSAVRPKS